MARGKAAARAANRRTSAATDRLAELEAALKDAQLRHREEVQRLKTELVQARSEMGQRAQELAQAELARLHSEVATATDQKSLSENLSWNTMLKQDRLIRNACRYLSMKSGRKPLDVLPMVIAWLTDEDVYMEDFADPAALLVKLGVERSGWVARTLRRVDSVLVKYEARASDLVSKEREPQAWSLDHVERHREHFGVHEKYKSKWYPRARYGGLSVYDDSEDDEEASAESA